MGREDTAPTVRSETRFESVMAMGVSVMPHSSIGKRLVLQTGKSSSILLCGTWAFS